MAKRVGGLLSVSFNGVRVDAKGSFTWNLGGEKREAVVGADGVHGPKISHQVAFIEGAITVREDTDVEAIKNAIDAVVVLELAQGRAVSLTDAWFAGDGNVTTEEGE